MPAPIVEEEIVPQNVEYYVRCELGRQNPFEGNPLLFALVGSDYRNRHADPPFGLLGPTVDDRPMSQHWELRWCHPLVPLAIDHVPDPARSGTYGPHRPDLLEVPPEPVMFVPQLGGQLDRQIHRKVDALIHRGHIFGDLLRLWGTIIIDLFKHFSFQIAEKLGLFLGGLL